MFLVILRATQFELAEFVVLFGSCVETVEEKALALYHGREIELIEKLEIFAHGFKTIK